MTGEGLIMHAIKSLTNNKSLRNKHNRTSQKDYKSSNYTPGNDPIKSTPKLLESIRTRIQAENKKRKKH